MVMNVKDISFAHEEVQAAIDRGATGIVVVAMFDDATRVVYCGEVSLPGMAVAVAMLQHGIHYELCGAHDSDGDGEGESA